MSYEKITFAFAVVGKGFNEECTSVDSVNVATNSMVIGFQRANQTTVIRVGTSIGPAHT